MPNSHDRRTVIRGAATAMSALALPAVSYAARSKTLPPFFEDLERRTFNYFWDLANPRNGLVPDRWPTPSFSSIAAIGFGLSAYVIGVERGWISRTAARDRTLLTLRFLAGLPMGPDTHGVAGYRGFYYHFLDMETGLRHGRIELSTVDTGLLFLGVLHVAQWFDRDDPAEAEIRKIADFLVNRAEWTWFQHNGLGIPMGWHPETGFIDRNWDGYNEGKLVYLLALGSTGHPVPPESWSVWTAPYPKFWRGEGKSKRLAFAPIWPGLYTEMWVDFRGIFDAPMRAAGFDYFENSRREAIANHHWCATNRMGWDGYAYDMWGLAACDGPGGHKVMRNGREVQFHGYSARGPVDAPDGFDDGTLAPFAAVGMMPFVPKLSIAAGMAMKKRYGSRLYGQYGFLDAFNPSFKDTSLKVDNGTVDPTSGWVGGDWLGIDQGAMLGMLANYRTGTIWRSMRSSPHIIRGLRRAGFTGGWLERAGPA